MRIDFHFNVGPSVVSYATRLLHKAHRSGARCAVWVDARDQAALSQALWTHGALSFLTHCTLPADATAMARSAVVLVSDASALPSLAPQGFSVLVTLTGEQADLAWPFDRLIDIVPSDAALKQAARARWRHYQQAGITPNGHDANLA